MTSCRQIVALLSSFQFMANLEQSGSQILEPQSVKLTFTITVTFYLAKTESRTKKFPTQLSHYRFDFLQKNANISKIKRTLVLKRISIILTRLRQGVILSSPTHPPENEPLKSPPRLGLENRKMISCNTKGLQ